MTEASRVQTLLNEQNAEIDRLKNRIAQLEDANLKQSCIKVDDQMRIEKLEAALRKIIDRAEFKNSEYVTDIVCRIARDALEGKDD